MDYTSEKKEILLLKELLQKKEKEKNKILQKLENNLEENNSEKEKIKKYSKNNNIDNNIDNNIGNNYFSGDEFSENDDNELYCKIGQKKTICVYGLRNKLPISMRPDQWEKLYEFMMSGKLHKFIKDNQKNLQ